MGTRARRRDRRRARHRPRVRRQRHARDRRGARGRAATRGRRSTSCSSGRNSLDADTGQVGPELAELLDLAFMTGVRHLALDGDTLQVRCEHDDGWLEAELRPARGPVVRRAAVRARRRSIPRAAPRCPPTASAASTAAELGAGPVGPGGESRPGSARCGCSPRRARSCAWPDAPLDEQVRLAVARARTTAARSTRNRPTARSRAGAGRRRATGGPVVAVVVEPDRAHLTARAARERRARWPTRSTAASLRGRRVERRRDRRDARRRWGADEIVVLDGANVEEDVAAGARELGARESRRGP